MEITFTEKRDGLNAYFFKKNYRLTYPEQIWQNYPHRIKKVWKDNAAHLLTMNIPMVSDHDRIKYNTSYPLFKSFFSRVVMKSIPSSADEHEHENAEKALRDFNNAKFEFADYKIKRPPMTINRRAKLHNAIVAFSMGKDSMLSLAVANELGLDPIAVYINDTVSPNENNTKLKHTKKLWAEHKITGFQVTNQFEKLNDFETWDKKETCLGYTHMMTGFSFIALPFVHYYNAGHIIMGNQQNMNFTFRSKDDFITYPSYDQSSEWMLNQNLMIKEMTAHQCGVSSLIEPLTNIPLTHVLFHRYPDFAKYTMSCDSLDGTRQHRWCKECTKCARISLTMRALNLDPAKVELKTLLGKKHRNIYPLFNSKYMDCYNQSKNVHDEQLLLFYMAYKNGTKGYLMELFRKKFLKEAQEREDELYKKFFRVYDAITLHGKMKKKVESIYKEELKEFY